MPIPQHLPHVIYATALTSLALHLHVKKKDSAEKHLLVNARIGVLESLVNRMRAGEDVSDEEILRLKRLTAGKVEDENHKDGSSIGWRAVFLGKSTTETKS